MSTSRPLDNAVCHPDKTLLMEAFLQVHVDSGNCHVHGGDLKKCFAELEVAVFEPRNHPQSLFCLRSNVFTGFVGTLLSYLLASRGV